MCMPPLMLEMSEPHKKLVGAILQNALLAKARLEEAGMPKAQLDVPASKGQQDAKKAG